jgi:LysM repeat protein
MSKESSHITPLSASHPRAGGKHRAPRRPSPLGRALALAVATGLAGVTPLVIGASPAHAEAKLGRAGDVNWDAVAQCESGGRWDTQTGNGFYGGLQFTKSTWLSNGGGEYAPSAHMANRQQQIAVANRVLNSQGIGAWPVCGARAGSGKRYRHRSGTGEASRSYKRRSYSSQHTSNGYRSNSSKYRTEDTARWERTTETRSHRSHYRKRTATVAPKVAPPTIHSGVVHAIPLAVPDFVPLRKYSSFTPTVQPQPAPVIYQVQPGDSLISIATSQKVSWQALYAQNRALIGANPDLIAPGARLVIG